MRRRKGFDWLVSLAEGPRPHGSLTRPDAVPLSPDTPTVLWTLRHGHRRLECSVQLLPHGLELYLALNGDTP